MTTQEMLSAFRKAITEYRLIADGDRIAVGISGGKDSLVLVTLLAAYQKFSPEKFSLNAINIDLGFAETPEKEKQAIADYCQSIGVPYESVKTDIGEILFDIRKEKNPCSLCSKMRRGALNDKARELGCNKLALGHHKDDLIETFFLSLLYEGRLSTFAPYSYLSRSDITLIRPMLFLDEKDIAAYAREMPVLHNACPADHFTQRESMKQYIKGLQKEIPFAKERIFSAITSPERYNLFDQYPRYTREKTKKDETKA